MTGLENLKRAKTFKREVAYVFSALIVYLAVAGKIEVLELLIWPLITFIAAALGMDWLSKQTDLVIERRYEP